MILKKPYAFLIKHFRAIHLAITLLLIYNATKLVKVVSFFNNYVRNNYQTSAVMDLHHTYLPFGLYFIIFLTIILTGTMLFLMLHKKKPSNLYIVTFLYYIIVFLGMFYIASVLKSFETSLLASTTSRTIRDILLLFYLPQIVFIVLFALRAVGFDFKKFDFSSDLKEMDYSLQDAEEFEVNINLEGYKAKRKFNRFIREFVYYIKENKFIVITIAIVLIGLLVRLIYNNTYSNFDNTYRMGSSFNFNGLNISFEEAMITNVDYNGNNICEDCYYVVIRTHMSNPGGQPIKIDYQNIKLQVDNKNYNPTFNDGYLFEDFAPVMSTNTFVPQSEQTFSLSYKIDKAMLNKSKRIVIFDGNVVQKGKSIDTHIIVNLRADKMYDINIVGNYSTGENIKFSESLLGNSNLKIHNYEIVGNNYRYTYKKCNTDNCPEIVEMITVPLNESGKTIMVLYSNLFLDKNSSYFTANKNIADFSKKFVKIQYRIDGQVYSSESKSLTPENSRTFMAFTVSNKIQKADIIQCIITIRDKKYIVNLKK